MPEAWGVDSLGIFALGEDDIIGLIDLEEADEEWPFDDLRPRDIGIYPVVAPIGGGMALTGKEPTIDSGAGHWRILYGAVPVKTRDKILLYRALEANLEGRANTIAVPIFDGKRAPWPGAPGGAIDAESANAVPEGATTIQIIPNDIGDLEAGMHFSVGSRLYRIESVDGESGVFDCTIWPEVREAFSASQPLEFRRPVCLCRLSSDDGMAMTLEGLKRGEATIEFVEAL